MRLSPSPWSTSPPSRARVVLVAIVVASSVLVYPGTVQAASFQVLEATVTTRDGVGLRTFAYIPSEGGPFPTLIYRTPYGAPIGVLGGYEQQAVESGVAPTSVGWPAITDAGYALVVQYTRGRFGSEGQDQLFLTDRTDGADLIEWIGQQSWSDGRIGSLGDSAYGITSLLLASAVPNQLDAAYAQVASGDLYNGSIFGPGGALKLETFLPWVNSQAASAGNGHYATLGLDENAAERQRAEAAEYGRMLRTQMNQAHESPIWKRLSLIDHPATSPFMPVWRRLLSEGYQSDLTRALQTSGAIEAPTLHVSMWHDVFNTASIETFLRVEQRTGTQRLMIMNGTHYLVDQPEVWPIKPMLRWFDHWLKGDAEALDEVPKISFEMGGAENEWYSAESWPPNGVEQRMYTLHGEGSLDSRPPLSSEPPRSFRYDPARPVPTVGGRNLVIESGPMDQRQVEPPVRADVLLYTSAPLSDDLVVMGPVTVKLHVGSDRVDTDFTAKLIDLHPDGAAMLVVDGIIRTRYRNGGSQEAFLSEGDVVEVAVDLGHIAHRFSVGHRLQVDISSSNFPQWDRNPNTGHKLYEGEFSLPARNTIYHDSERASTLFLPVLEDSGGIVRLDW